MDRKKTSITKLSGLLIGSESTQARNMIMAKAIK